VAVNPFPGWLAEIAADPIVICPDCIDAEAHGNLWSFALSPEQAAVVSVTDVEAFAAGVADGRRAWLMAHRSEQMVLYWWHDAQAGQLRFSLVSAAHNRLPFGCEVAPAASIKAVAADWLGSPALHGIPWDELTPLIPNAVVPELPALVLPVCSVALLRPPADT
jgi:hypothetical protein